MIPIKNNPENIQIGTIKLTLYKPNDYLAFFPQLFSPEYSFNELIIFSLLDKKGTVKCTRTQSKWIARLLNAYGVSFLVIEINYNFHRIIINEKHKHVGKPTFLKS